MDKLLHTSLFRAILKSLNRKVVSEKRLQTYFLKFARLITALCDDTDCLSALHTLNYTQIQFRFLLSRIHEPSVSLPPYIHRVVDMTLEFICLEIELLYHRIEHPRSFISEPAFTSPLHWSKHYPAISVSEILCGLDRMTPPPFVLADVSSRTINWLLSKFSIIRLTQNWLVCFAKMGIFRIPNYMSGYPPGYKKSKKIIHLPYSRNKAVHR